MLQSKPMLWDHGVDRHWFADCGCSDCTIGGAAGVAVKGKKDSVKPKKDSVKQEKDLVPATSYPAPVPVVTFTSREVTTGNTRHTAVEGSERARKQNSSALCLPLHGPQAVNKALKQVPVLTGQVWPPIAGSGAEETPGLLVTEFTSGNKEHGVEDDLKKSVQKEYGPVCVRHQR